MFGFLSRGAREHVAMIDRHLRPFLRQHRFRLKAVRGAGHEWTAVYVSRECQLAIYDSARNGEVNCMIALPSAPSGPGAVGREHGWHHIFGFLNEGLSFDELLALVPENAVSREEQMRKVANALEGHFPMMFARISAPSADVEA